MAEVKWSAQAHHWNDHTSLPKNVSVSEYDRYGRKAKVRNPFREKGVLVKTLVVAIRPAGYRNGR